MRDNYRNIFRQRSDRPRKIGSDLFSNINKKLPVAQNNSINLKRKVEPQLEDWSIVVPIKE